MTRKAIGLVLHWAASLAVNLVLRKVLQKVVGLEHYWDLMRAPKMEVGWVYYLAASLVLSWELRKVLLMAPRMEADLVCRWAASLVLSWELRKVLLMEVHLVCCLDWMRAARMAVGSVYYLVKKKALRKAAGLALHLAEDWALSWD